MVRRVVVVGVDVVLIDDVVRDDANRRLVGGTGEYVQHKCVKCEGHVRDRGVEPTSVDSKHVVREEHLDLAPREQVRPLLAALAEDPTVCGLRVKARGLRTEELEGDLARPTAFGERGLRDAFAVTVVRARPFPDVDLDVGGGDDVGHWRWADGHAKRDRRVSVIDEEGSLSQRITHLHSKWANVPNC